MLLNCDLGEDFWESLGLQGDQTVNPKRNQSWIFFGRTDAKAEAPILWPLDTKSWFIEKDADVGKDGRQKEKRAAEYEGEDSENKNLRKPWQIMKDREACVLQVMGSQRVGYDLKTEQ